MVFWVAFDLKVEAKIHYRDRTGRTQVTTYGPYTMEKNLNPWTTLVEIFTTALNSDFISETCQNPPEYAGTTYVIGQSVSVYLNCI